MKTFVCTCGTSILTKRDIKINRIASVPLFMWDEMQDDIEQIREHTKDLICKIDTAEVSEISAEVNSLVKMGLKADDEVILLSTDTIDGKLSSDLIKWFLYTRNLCNEGLIRIEKIDGLQATDGARFRIEGLKNLFNLLTKYEHGNVVFNLTGGFKSVVPYISLMGMLFNKPVQYIHEDSNDVITLANIPIAIDEDIIFRVEDKLRKIEVDSCITSTEWRSGLDFHDRRFDCLVEIEGDKVTISGLGLILWERFKRDFPEDLIRDDKQAFEKENKLRQQGIAHHGLARIKPIANRLLSSPYVRGIPNSCNNQPKSPTWVKPLNATEAKAHILRECDGLCIVTDRNSDEGFSFLIQTTGRNYEETKKIADILNYKFFHTRQL